MAELIPSSELGLINPAASPMRNTPSPPQQKLLGLLGRSTRQASVDVYKRQAYTNFSKSFFSRLMIRFSSRDM